MEIVYRAFDGMIFNSEKDCTEYEATASWIPHGAKLYDRDMNEIRYIGGNEFAEAYDTCEYIELMEDTTFDEWAIFGNNWGYYTNGLGAKGLYIWNERDYRWDFIR